MVQKHEVGKKKKEHRENQAPILPFSIKSLVLIKSCLIVQPRLGIIFGLFFDGHTRDEC